MKFGIMFANTGPFATPEGASALATAADEMGLESIWAVEHVVIPHGYQSQYPDNETGKIPAGRIPTSPTRCCGCPSWPARPAASAWPPAF